MMKLPNFYISSNPNENLSNLLELSNNTLPGLIITFMKNSNTYVTLDQIIEFIRPKFSELRKTNGCKYKVY